MTSPRVSVVLPTHDAGEFVSGAISSVIDGTFGDLELLVVDDGSTDGTVEAVRAFEKRDDRIRLVEREATGLPSALNRGVREARGEYVARQDADDRSRPTRLERQVAVLDDSPDLAGVGTGAILRSESGERIARRHVRERVSLEQMQGGNPFIHGSMLLRTKALKSVGGYDESLPYSEDYDLWVRLLGRYRLGNLNEPLYELRLREGSIYGSELSAVKLLRRFAFKRATGTLPPGATERVIEDGAQAMYEYLTPTERCAHHEELAVELLRYGNREAAREACRDALALSRTAPVAYAVFGLSVLPEPAVRLAVRATRCLKNCRVRLANRNDDR